MKLDIKQQVTDKIIEHLEAADLGQWEKPFFGMSEATNIKSGKAYRGINVFLLSISGHGSAYWGTFKQWKEQGAKIRKGSKGTHIVFWSPIVKKDKATGEETDRFMMCKGYVVFNADQCDEVPEKFIKADDVKPQSFDDLKHAESLITATGIQITHTDAGKAFYTPALDSVQLPNKANFKATKTSTAAECYYSTAFHEIGHATGHKSRLNRDLNNRFGDQAYAAEELIAELCAAYMCQTTGVSQSVRADHSQYIKSWLKVLKNDKNAIFTASSAAQKAADWIIEQSEEMKAAA